MNKTITKSVADRITRCVFTLNNRKNCYEKTGIHHTTIERMLEREFAKEEQLTKILDYCDEVEGLTVKNTQD